MLTLKTDGPFLDWFNPAPATLTRLDTTYGRGSILYNLSDLQKLHYLCIRDATEASTYKGNTITLPHLSELHIYGNHDRIIANLVTPQLEKLVVFFSSQDRFKRSLPPVPLVEWTFDQTDAPDISQRITLMSILETATETSRLSLRGFKVELVEEIGSRFKCERGVSSSLKAVDVLIGDARTIICDWGEMNPG